MPIIQFDTLDYFEKLKGAGAPEELAKIQANALRDFSQSMDEKNRQQLATKGDLHDVRNELQTQILEFRNDLQQQIQEVRSELKSEMQAVQASLHKEMQAVQANLHKEMQAVQANLHKEIQASSAELRQLIYSMMKWGLTIVVAIFGVMAKGFGWLGFLDAN